MKKLIFSLLLSVLFLNMTTAQRGAERTGFDGDNFSLEGALELFKLSHSIEDFERKLNTRDRYVNNLDLNFDGRIDYVRVEHKRRGNFHAVILQVPISRRDIQDIAVIEIEKTGRRSAMLQIIGDDYLYGNQVIVEPIARGGDSYRNGAVNVYRWPAVRNMLRRTYNPWISPYRYSYYPTWWSPWRQYAYMDYYPHTSYYRSHYHYVNNFRVWRVHDFYRPYRVYCPIIVTRSNNVHVINRTTRQTANVVNRNNDKRDVKKRDNIINKTRTTAPTRVTRTNTSTTKRRTSTPTRTISPTRATKSRATSPSRTTSPSRSTYRPKTTTTTKRRSTSSVQRSSTRVSRPKTSTTRRATTSKKSTSRVAPTKRTTRSNRK